MYSAAQMRHTAPALPLAAARFRERHTARLEAGWERRSPEAERHTVAQERHIVRPEAEPAGEADFPRGRSSEGLHRGSGSEELHTGSGLVGAHPDARPAESHPAADSLRGPFAARSGPGLTYPGDRNSTC